MIRDFIEQDRDIFMDFVDRFYHSEAVMTPVSQENYVRSFQLALEKSPYVRGLILTHEDEPAGYALLSFTYSNEVGGIVVLIEELYIDPKMRGNGLGTAFFDFIHAEYPQAKRFRLEVRGDNAGAIALYERLGYERFSYVQMVRDCEA